MSADWSDALRAICRERTAFYGEPACFTVAAGGHASPCDRCLGYEEARSQAQALALMALDPQHAGLLIADMLPGEG